MTQLYLIFKTKDLTNTHFKCGGQAKKHFQEKTLKNCKEKLKLMHMFEEFHSLEFLSSLSKELKNCKEKLKLELQFEIFKS